jgi:hypothetical protein
MNKSGNSLIYHNTKMTQHKNGISHEENSINMKGNSVNKNLALQLWFAFNTMVIKHGRTKN